jgi:HSP20 family protein
MSKTKDLEFRTDPAPVRWLTDWFEMPDLFHRFGTLRPMVFPDRMKVEEELVDGKLVIRAELPGVDPDNDVEIMLGDGVLRISAERKQHTEEKAEGRFRSEFSYGTFTRRVPMPSGAKADDVKATYCDGILEVTIPVATEAEAMQKVPVTKT